MSLLEGEVPNHRVDRRNGGHVGQIEASCSGHCIRVGYFDGATIVASLHDDA